MPFDHHLDYLLVKWRVKVRFLLESYRCTPRHAEFILVQDPIPIVVRLLHHRKLKMGLKWGSRGIHMGLK